MRNVQANVCGALEALERELGSDRSFVSDAWTRPGGGGGVSRVLQDGAILEKAGVNVSEVYGELSQAFAAKLPGTGRQFYATGVSLVLHPRNPYVPTVHANFRYLEQGERRWFGGGSDLTPYYFFAEDKSHFHGVWRDVCERHHEVANYASFRDACERYFYLPHRGEVRGVGGIFFDDVEAVHGDVDREDALLAFVSAGGAAILDAYLPIVRRRMHTPWGDRERNWQLLRRGRYVEFNLLYDRGTTFGLQTGGRTESILMSLPPLVRWGYDESPSPGSPEAALLDQLRRAEPP